MRTEAMQITHAFSFGGGVQSGAALVLAATGRLPEYRHFVMADVGEDSENPATIKYVDEIAVPYAAEHGIRLEIIKRLRRDKTPETLFQRLTKEGSRSLPIPVRMSNTGAPGTRSCTADFKIRPLAKWAKQNGGTAERPMIVGIGISTDEASRARSDSGFPHQRLDYPLLRMKISRPQCLEIIAAAGLPLPPKSSCFFCPLHTLRFWVEQKRTEPDLFERSCQLEELLNERRKVLGKDPVYFCTRLKPLREAIRDDKNLRLFADEEWEYSCGPYVCAGK